MALLLDIAKDIYEELDIVVVFIKILQNVGRLVSADRCSLFLVDQEKNELYSKVFRPVEHVTDVELVSNTGRDDS